MLFTLVTFPYASRVLQPDGLGKIGFLQSVVSYFLMLSSLGIPLYGIREIARVRDSKAGRTRVAHELFLLNAGSTLVVAALFLLAILLVPQFRSEYSLLLTLGSSLFFSLIGIDWLYQGLEDFVYITLRSIAFQALSLILLFILVRSPEDLFWYALLTVISSGGSSILNLIHARTCIGFFYHGPYDIRRHVRPVLRVFLMNLAVSVYANLDSVMLGFLAGERQVGLYSAAIKLVRIVLMVLASLGTVLLPRSSYYLKNVMTAEFQSLISRSLRFMLMFALPAFMGLVLLAEKTILFLSGEAFLEAVPALQIISGILVFISVSNIIGIQIFLPMGKETYTIVSVATGAVINFSLNVLFIPKYGATGAAFTTLIAEGAVTAVQIVLAWGYVKAVVKSRSLLNYILATLLLSAGVLLVLQVIHTDLPALVVSVLCGLLIYAAVLWGARDELFLVLLEKVTTKLSKRIGNDV